jgi:signal transduction histidine kinase
METRRAEQRLDRDLSRTAHDLKAPLSAVKGYVDMMLRGIAGPMPPNANRYLARIREVVDRERQLIDERLRPRGQQPSAPPVLDLARALGASLARSEPGLRARLVRLTVDLPPRECPITARPSLAELLARRLVRHLLASTPAGGTAHLALRDDLGRRWIELSPGAPPSRDLRIALAAAERMGAHPAGGDGPDGDAGTVRIDLPYDL